MDVAPAMELLVLLPSPTAAGSVLPAHGRRALAVVPTQPYSANPTAGAQQSTGTTGRTRTNATGGMRPEGCHAMTCYPLRDGRAYQADGPGHQKRARPSHGPQGKDMAPTQPYLSCHLGGGDVPLYKSPHHTGDATRCTRSCRAGTHSPDAWEISPYVSCTRTVGATMTHRERASAEAEACRSSLNRYKGRCAMPY